MHLAHAVGTPIVAVFGPSDPRRYAPRGPLDRVVRVDLPCAPCNRIRLPPARCQGITPDCLALVSSERVYDAAAAVLDQLARRSPGEGGLRAVPGEGRTGQTSGRLRMIAGTVNITTTSQRTVALDAYLDPRDEEAAHRDAHAWIKKLRHAKVEGRGFRQRFTVRGDSLWWFTEIYLHKERALVDIHRAIAATRALLAQEQPSRLEVTSGSVVVRHVVTLVAKASGLRAGRRRRRR